MIDYVSTRDTGIRVRSGKAVLDGQASDGGLYVPQSLDDIRIDYHDAIKGGFRDMAKAVWKVFFDDYGADKTDELVEKSYRDKFAAPEITQRSGHLRATLTCSSFTTDLRPHSRMSLSPPFRTCFPHRGR